MHHAELEFIGAIVLRPNLPSVQPAVYLIRNSCEDFMSGIPLLIKKSSSARKNIFESIDQLVFDDDLPTALFRDVSGYLLARTTRITEVNQETTDDI